MSLIKENIELLNKIDALNIKLFGDIYKDSKHIEVMNKELKDIIELYESFLNNRGA